jgi:DNA-directed RNA polymerase specialized sigma24 family protein
VVTTEEHALRSTWPTFLDLIEREPQTAFEQFSEFAIALLRTRPPRIFGDLSRADREDMIHEIILHCRKDDFRVLRQYRDRGFPFSTWFQRTAHNKVIDFIRSRPAQGDPNIEEQTDTDRGPSVEMQPDVEALIDSTLSALSEMKIECRLLILAGGLEFSPLQMTRLLGWQRTQNKKASDMARDCRRRLKQLLDRAGVDLSRAMPILG